MTRGNKDLCGVSGRKRNNEKTINNDVTFIVLQKNMRSMHSSERIEEMVYYCVKRGGMTKKKRWETHHKHIFMGAGKYDNKTRRWYLTEQEVETKNC